MFIAIVTRLYYNNGKLRYYISDYFKKVADKLNIILVPIVSLKSIDKISVICNGLIVPGSGNDINPCFYGEISSKRSKIDAEYLLDQGAIWAFSKLNKPIIGICGGMQAINVAFGGTLYQDITNHNNINHKIRIEKDSKLFKFYRKNEVKVNSFHHQSIKRVALGFKICARSEDGVIEGIENGNIIGVQYHPEVMKDYDFFKFFLA